MAGIEEITRSPIRLQLEKALLSLVDSRLRIAVAVVVIGGATFVSEYVVHLFVTRTSALEPFQAFADSLILSSLAASFSLLILATARERHRKMRDDLRMIAELNHQVRNALQLIVYGEYSPDGTEHRPAVLAGVDKIEAALKELFPLVGERTDDRPWDAHNQARLPGHTPRRSSSQPERRRA